MWSVYGRSSGSTKTATSDYTFRQRNDHGRVLDVLRPLRLPLFPAAHTGRLQTQRMCEVRVAVGSLGVPSEESPSSAEQGAG